MLTHTATGWLINGGGTFALIPRFTHDRPPTDASEQEIQTFGIPLVLIPGVTGQQPDSWVSVSGGWDGTKFAVEAFGAPEFDDGFTVEPANTAPGHRTRPRYDEHSRAVEGALLASGAIVSRRYLSAPDKTWRVVISAPDPDAVRESLTALHGDLLTLVQSRWTQQQYRDAGEHLAHQVELWALSTLIDQINDDGVDHIIATPRAITAEIQAWHQDLPAGLVTLKPMIRPT